MSKANQEKRKVGHPKGVNVYEGGHIVYKKSVPSKGVAELDTLVQKLRKKYARKKLIPARRKGLSEK